MTLEEQINKFIKSGDIEKCVDFLVKNTGMDKLIKPDNIEEMEKYYSILFHVLNKNGGYRGLNWSAFKLLEHLKTLEKKDKTHYHKGLEYHNVGIALYRLALSNFLKAFIEDAIRKQENFPLTPGRQHLEGLFKANKEDLKKIGEHAIASSKNNLISSEEILDKFIRNNGEPYVELWQVENNISQIEKEVRECINKTLGQNWMNDKSYVRGNEKKEISRRQMREQAILGKAASNSLIDYLSFSDYARVVKYGESKFKPIFGDVDEFVKNRITYLWFIKIRKRYQYLFDQY